MESSFVLKMILFAMFMYIKSWTVLIIDNLLNILTTPVLYFPLLIMNMRMQREHDKLRKQLEEAQAETRRLMERKRIATERKNALLREIELMNARQAIHQQQMAEFNGVSCSLAA